MDSTPQELRIFFHTDFSCCDLCATYILPRRSDDPAPVKNEERWLHTVGREVMSCRVSGVLEDRWQKVFGARH